MPFELDYMPYVTNNTDTFVQGQQNLVACVYCIEIYESDVCEDVHNCLICKKCGVDALMVVKHSPLNEMLHEERMKKLADWHAYGFTPI
jgi:phenolic acid decarboxylase